MWAGLFWSRALLSLSTALFLGYALYVSGLDGVKEVLRSIWLKSLILLFFVPFISGLWSADKYSWLVAIFNKLPLLIFPFTLPAFREINQIWSKRLLYILIGLIMLSILYSTWNYVTIPNISISYLKAKVLKVWMQDDHVRYSLLMLISLLWVIHHFFISTVRKEKSWIGYIFIGISGIFIHILATKTGILGFYLLITLLIIYKVKGFVRLGFIAVLFSTPLFAWFLIPSFQNRFRFVLWDFQHYSRGGYVEGLSDTPRVLSWQAGFDIFTNNIFMGVGAGDVKTSTVNWYLRNSPHLKDYERLIPSNEILLYACIGGLLSGLVMLLILGIPFFLRQRQSFLWVGFHSLIIMISMYEVNLETQFGVFLYAFFSMLFFTISSQDHTSSISSIAK